MQKGSKVAIVCCSNGKKQSYGEKLELLKNTLLHLGLVPVFGDCIFERNSVFSGTGRERAESLMGFYRDNEINAIFKKTGKKSVLYQVRNLICDAAEAQIENFCSTVFDGTDRLFSYNYEFIQKEEVQGILIGGNIRCLLKLAGTEYWPDMDGKVLLLEGLHGTVPQMTTYLNQLEQIGVFHKVSGILLGTFTEMEEKNCIPTMTDLVKKYAGREMPIIKTLEIGHGSNSKGIVIGQEYHWSIK